MTGRQMAVGPRALLFPLLSPTPDRLLPLFSERGDLKCEFFPLRGLVPWAPCGSSRGLSPLRPWPCGSSRSPAAEGLSNRLTPSRPGHPAQHRWLGPGRSSGSRLRRPAPASHQTAPGQETALGELPEGSGTVQLPCGGVPAQQEPGTRGGLGPQTTQAVLTSELPAPGARRRPCCRSGPEPTHLCAAATCSACHWDTTRGQGLKERWGN